MSDAAALVSSHTARDARRVDPADSHWLALLIVVAIVARLIAAMRLGSGIYFLDEGIYLDAARALASGDGYAATYTRIPGYPAMLAALTIVSGHSVFAIRALQGVLCGGGTVLVYAIARRMIGPLPGLAAALIYALDPLLVVSAALLYPEAIAALLLVTVVLAVRAGAIDDRPTMSLAAGILLGALALLRPVALVLLVPAALWIAWIVHSSPRRRLAHVALVALGVGAAIAPWTVRNYRVHGRLVPIAMPGRNNMPASATGSEQDGVVADVASGARHDPLAFATHVISELAHFWEPVPLRLKTDQPSERAGFQRRDPRLAPDIPLSRTMRDVASALAYGFEMLFAVWGLVIAWRLDRRDTMLLALLILAYAFGFAVFVGRIRYRIVVLPLLFVFTGTALARLLIAIRHNAAQGALLGRSGPREGDGERA